VTGSAYAAEPWPALLNDARRDPVGPVDSLAHAPRSAVAQAPDGTFRFWSSTATRSPRSMPRRARWAATESLGSSAAR
jgi:hypothetical protein